VAGKSLMKWAATESSAGRGRAPQGRVRRENGGKKERLNGQLLVNMGGSFLASAEDNSDCGGGIAP